MPGLRGHQGQGSSMELTELPTCPLPAHSHPQKRQYQHLHVTEEGTERTVAWSQGKRLACQVL